MRKRELRSFLVIGAVIGSIFMFSIVYFTVFLWYRNNIREEAKEISKNIADNTFNTFSQVMKMGWNRDELLDLIDANKELFKRTPYSVEIYRGEIIESLYGKIKQPAMDKVVLESFNYGNEKIIEKKDLLRFIYPIKARAECLGCHTNARRGDVLGVIDVSSNFSLYMAEGKKKIGLIFLLLFPVPVFGSWLVSSFLSRRLKKSVNIINQRIDSVNTVKDLTKFEMNDIDLTFDEFNTIFKGLRQTIHKLKEVAVDKDILEFEIKLLEKFVITSEMVKDWKDHIKHIMVEINRLMEVYCLFSIFAMTEETSDLEIFWRNTPDTNTKELLEKIIKQNIAKHRYFNHLVINTVHNICLPLASLPKLKEDTIELQTKTLILETPKIGGIIGIGVSVDIPGDPTRSLVIESVLTTLLNVVGSIKAIYKYTKDLEYYATRDPLTGLFNQRLFWELLNYEEERAKRHGYKFSILVIDIDNFKVINDIYGHIFGDKFLQGIGEEIRRVFRKEDIVCRYGGDEFAGVILDSDTEQAFHTAKRLRENLKEFSLKAPDGVQVKATVSTGIAVYPDHAKTPKEMFMLADNMMLNAKSSGKDKILIPTLDDIAYIFKGVSEKNMMVINAIDDKRIIPYFQPIMNTKTKKIEAYETLMRIEFEDKIITASEFIESASDIGVINKMEYQLMEKIFQRVSEVKYNGNMFINISPKALIFSEYIPTVHGIIKNYNLDPARIVFEITERDTIRNLNLLEKFVLDLKFEGFKFAIDDFGSGFSSFQYIKFFPIDFVKLEGEFIRSMLVEENIDRSIVNSIATFCKNVGIKTVAEFVENEETLKAIELLDVDYVQGFHIGRPSPELKNW